MWRLLCGFGVLWCVTSAWAASPQRITATYDLYRGEMLIAVVEEQFEREGDGYRLSSVARPVGLLAMFRPETIQTNSSGQVTAQGLRPLTFHYVREKDAARSSSALFDWQKGSVVVTLGAAQQTLTLPIGAQDRLSGMYQFMFQPVRAGTSVTFPLLNGVSMNSQRYVVAAGEQCALAPSNPATWYLDNQSKPGESRTEIWLLRQSPVLPCKIRMTEGNGTVFVQQLRRLVVVP